MMGCSKYIRARDLASQKGNNGASYGDQGVYEVRRVMGC